MLQTILKEVDAWRAHHFEVLGGPQHFMATLRIKCGVCRSSTFLSYRNLLRANQTVIFYCQRTV